MFNVQLKKCRIKKGFTQVELCKKAGISQAALCHYEKGIRSPTKEAYDKIVSVLNVKIALPPQRKECIYRISRIMQGLSKQEINAIMKFAQHIKDNSKNEIC